MYSHIDEWAKLQLLQLWNMEYPKLLNMDEYRFNEYLNGLTDVQHYIIKDEPTENIIAWGFSFLRLNEKWFGLILDHKYQNKGIGSLLLSQMKNDNTSLNGWVIIESNYLLSDNRKYKSPLLFYLKNDCKVDNDSTIFIHEMKAIKIYWIK